MSKKIIWESDFARASERAINEEKLIYPEELENGWKKLRSLYPMSDWRLKQTMVEKY